MFQKTFEVLQAIDDLATEYYEKIKTDCDTYEDLEKGLRGMSYVDFGRFNTSRDYLVKVMRQKIEKEKSNDNRGHHTDTDNQRRADISQEQYGNNENKQES